MKIYELRDEVVSYLKKNFYLFSDEEYTVIASYVLLCWTFQRFDEIPYLSINGRSGCGKSQLGYLLKNLLPEHPSKCGSLLSEQALFQINTKCPAPWIIDELDSIFAAQPTNMKIFLSIGNVANSWFCPIYRREDENFEYGEVTNAFSPKILISTSIRTLTNCIGHSISINLPEIGITELIEKKIPLSVMGTAIKEAYELREKIVLWKEQFHGSDRKLSPEYLHNYFGRTPEKLLMGEIEAMAEEEKKFS